MVAASTWPAILAGADMSRKSSMMPTTKMAAAPRIRPSGSEDPRNSGLRAGIEAAIAQATSRATNMATPPASGVTCCVHLAFVGLGHVPDLDGDVPGREGEQAGRRAATTRMTPYQLSGMTVLTGPAGSPWSRTDQCRVRREPGAQLAHLGAHLSEFVVVVTAGGGSDRSARRSPASPRVPCPRWSRRPNRAAARRS